MFYYCYSNYLIIFHTCDFVFKLFYSRQFIYHNNYSFIILTQTTTVKRRKQAWIMELWTTRLRMTIIRRNSQLVLILILRLHKITKSDIFTFSNLISEKIFTKQARSPYLSYILIYFTSLGSSQRSNNKDHCTYFCRWRKIMSYAIK